MDAANAEKDTPILIVVDVEITVTGILSEQVRKLWQRRKLTDGNYVFNKPKLE